MKKKHNLLNKGKTFLVAGTTLATVLLGAEEARAEKHFTKQKLEEKISRGELDKRRDINVIFNYYIENEQKPTDYLTSKTMINQNTGDLAYTSNILKLSSEELKQIENLIKDIKKGNINSYQDFINSTNNFSEDQNLLLSSAIGDLSEKLYEKSKDKVSSQNDFFSNLQSYLELGNKNNLGVCRHIHSHIEQLANDIGINAAAVSGFRKNSGHIYTITKTENGSAILDYGNLLITDTKNIEKTLEAYQKHKGTTVFKHDFYEDNEFKYKLITKDGERFLNFLESEENSKTLKNLLIYNIEKDARTNFIFEHGNYLNSIEINSLGFFGKIGEIIGDLSSPMEKMKLFQGGYKRKFNVSVPILGKLKIDGNLSFVKGRINQDFEVNDNNLKGYNFDLGFSLDKEKGFKAGFRGFLNKFKKGDYILLKDYMGWAGISYKNKNEKIDIEPYLITKISAPTKKIDETRSGIKFSEFCIGTLFDFNSSKNTTLSLEPYYINRIWEQEVGINSKFETKKFGASINGYTTKSNYEFCPDKEGFNVEIYKNFGNWKVWSEYEIKNSDYDSEREKEREFNLGVSFKF
jgi:hypothetical protein